MTKEEIHELLISYTKETGIEFITDNTVVRDVEIIDDSCLPDLYVGYLNEAFSIFYINNYYFVTIGNTVLTFSPYLQYIFGYMDGFVEFLNKEKSE